MAETEEQSAENVHFEQVIFGDDRGVTQADINFILDAYIAAVEERGLLTGGGAFPCTSDEGKCRGCR